MFEQLGNLVNDLQTIEHNFMKKDGGLSIKCSTSYR